VSREAVGKAGAGRRAHDGPAGDGGGALKGAVRKGRMTAACTYHSIGLLTAPQTEGPMRLVIMIAAAVVVIAIGYTLKATMFPSRPRTF
jgi:hypothetical protein